MPSFYALLIVVSLANSSHHHNIRIRIMDPKHFPAERFSVYYKIPPYANIQVYFVASDTPLARNTEVIITQLGPHALSRNKT